MRSWINYPITDWVQGAISSLINNHWSLISHLSLAPYVLQSVLVTYTLLGRAASALQLLIFPNVKSLKMWSYYASCSCTIQSKCSCAYLVVPLPFRTFFVPLLNRSLVCQVHSNRNAISAINWSIVDESQMLDSFGRYTYRLNLCGEHRIGMASKACLELKWDTRTTRNWSRER